MNDERRENDSILLELLKEILKETRLSNAEIVEMKLRMPVLPSRPCTDFQVLKSNIHTAPCEQLREHLTEQKEERSKNTVVP